MYIILKLLFNRKGEFEEFAYISCALFCIVQMNVYVSSLSIMLHSKEFSYMYCISSFALLSVTLTNIFSWIRQTTGKLPSILCLKFQSKVQI